MTTTLAGVSVLALALTGCSTGGDSSQVSSLTFVSWGGVFQEAQIKAFGTPFTAETDISVKSDGPTDYAKIKVQVESNNVDWDVVTVEPFWAEQQCGTLVESLADIDRSELMPGAASDCGIPVSATAYVLGYNEDAYPDAAPSKWADFFDVNRFPGKRAVWNYAPGQALEVALLADGVAPEDLYPLDIDRALAKLDTIRDSIAFFDTGAQLTQMLESGEAAMGITWNGRGYDAAVNGAPVKPVWDDSLILFDVLTVPKGAKDPEAAKEFIKTAISQGAQQEFVNLFPSGTSNTSVAAPSDDLMNAWSPDGAGKGKSTLISTSWWAENYSAATDAWTAWAAG